MATEYNITQKQYNGVDYDTLYPQTTGQQVLLNDDTILYSGIPTVNGALIKQQEDITALNGNLNRLFRTYSNLTVTDTNPYALIDSYASMGIDSSKYLLSMNIRGWSGVSCGGMSLAKGSNGTDIYVMGSKAGSIASLTVEYFFANTVGSF